MFLYGMLESFSPNVSPAEFEVERFECTVNFMLVFICTLC